LFENPYASPDAAARTVRRPDFQQKADLAQRRSIVLLKNAGRLLPLRPGARVYVEGVDAALAARYAYASSVRDVARQKPALLDVVFGKHAPTGKLPFEMPSSMDAVRAQLEDVPHDSKAPLFPIGHGLRYSN
jgi:beta-glucosidase-like glycosyl hydrolase